MNNMELMWIYRHAWRGAGPLRKCDHVVTQESQEDKPSSMFKALTMYFVWDKWIMPRCDAIPQRHFDDPERWALSNIDDVRAAEEIPPLGQVRWECLLLDQLSHEKCNLFRLWYEDLQDYERSFGMPLCKRHLRNKSIGGRTSGRKNLFQCSMKQ